MFKGNKLFRKILLGILFLAFFLWLAFKDFDGKKFIEIFQKVEWTPIFFSSFLVMLAHYLRSLRWKFLLRKSNKDISKFEVFSALIVGYFVNSFVPRMGEFARAFFLKRISGTSSVASLSSIVIDRILDLFALLGLFLVILILHYSKLSMIIPSPIYSFGLLIGITSLLLGVTYYIYRDPSRISKFANKLGTKFFPKRELTLAKTSRNFIEGLTGLFDRTLLIPIFSLTILIWFVYLLSVWILFYAFPFSKIFSMGFTEAFFLMFMLSIGVMIPSPAGTGSIHYFVSFALTNIFLSNPNESLVFATIVHGVGFVPVVFMGIFLCFWGLFLKSEVKFEDKDI